MTTAPAPTLLAIADEDDLIVTVSASDLIDALLVAVDQFDVKTDEEAAAYGIDTAADAAALRARLTVVLNAVNGAS